jgi:hypothetical protein
MKKPSIKRLKYLLKDEEEASEEYRSYAKAYPEFRVMANQEGQHHKKIARLLKRKIAEAKCPGGKIRSKGKGRGLGTGRGKGPIGIPVGAKKGRYPPGRGLGRGRGGAGRGLGRGYGAPKRKYRK